MIPRTICLQPTVLPLAKRVALLLLCAVVGLVAKPGGVRAEDGYQLWLRYVPVSNKAKLDEYQQTAREIVVQGKSPTADAIRQELHRGLSGLLGRDVPVVEQANHPGVLVAGTPDDSATIAGLKWGDDLRALGKDGYLIRSVRLAGNPATVIASQSEIGALYGTFAFLRLLQTEQDIANLKLVDKPRLQLRLLNHWDNPNGSIERGYAGKSIWKWNSLPDTVDPRYVDYARANASLGINGAVLNNVNAKPEQLDTPHLQQTAIIAKALRPYGIRVYLSANFGAPKAIGHLPTADPLDPDVQRWWKQKADEIYQLIPDFGGWLVKADSEGQPGPQTYHRTHTDGANMLADALAPHGGIVMWRAFVYNEKIDPDRVKRAYKEFQPLDGSFRPNVIVQVKNGPLDFQPREPFSALFGQMPKTSLVGEVEITQEYLGRATHLVYLAPMWKEFLNADTYAHGKGSSIANVLQGCPRNGLAGVANVGEDRNWCGYDFAQANWYAFGRLAWNDQLGADAIAEEWTRMTWGNQPAVVQTIMAMLRGSREALVNYETPIGLHHLVDKSHSKPGMKAREEYHMADGNGIGSYRDSKGSDAVGQYLPPVRDQLDNLTTCPDEVLLWFHHVSWDYRMHSGRSVWDELCYRYNAGVDYVKTMQTQWQSLQGQVDAERFADVSTHLNKQLGEATEWRDTCVRYFQSINQKPLPGYLQTTTAAP